MEERKSEIQEYLQQGEVLLQSGRYEQAAEYAKKGLAIDPMNLQAYLLQGASYAYAKDYAQAEECFKRAILLDKKSALAHYHMGSVHLMKGEIEEGIEEYQNALENGYDDPDIYFNMGLAYEEREDYERASREYSRAIRKDSLNPLYYIRKVQLYMMQAKDEEALKVLEELRRRCPDNFEGYHYAAQIYSGRGEFERADEILQKAEAEFSEDMDILLDRLRILVAKGDVEDALKEVEKAEQLSESGIHRKELLLNRAKLKGIQENMDECIAILEQALTEGEDEVLDTEIHYLLVNAYRMGENFEHMKTHAAALEHYAAENPYALGAKYFLALAEEKNEEGKRQAYQDAIRYYRNFALEHPEHIESYIYRAVCHKEIGEFEKALETIDYVMLLHETGKLWLIKGAVLEEMGRKEEAAEALKKAGEYGEDISLWKEA